MHLSVLLFLCVIAAGCVTATSTYEAKSRSCWSATLQFDEGNNFVSLCIEDPNVEMLMFYSNNEKTPTICRQVGLIDGELDTVFDVNLERGRCENSRKMAASTLKCTRSSVHVFHCSVTEDFEMEFHRERKDLAIIKSDDNDT